MKKENTARKTTLAFVIPVLIILAWYLATTYNDIPTGILPTIPMVGQAFVDMDRQCLGFFLDHLLECSGQYGNF